MDIWKFYGITHKRHVICNPTSEEKLAQLVELLHLPSGARVVDIACGKGEFLIRLVEAYGISGLGIDISPYFLAEAEMRLKARAPDADVTFTEMNGADFRPDEPHSYNLASCIGASWLFGGHTGTLDALVSMVEPGGWVIAGEPYWLQKPSAEYLEASGDTREGFGTHAENVVAGERQGRQGRRGNHLHRMEVRIPAVKQVLVGPFEVEGIGEGFTYTAVPEYWTTGVEHKRLHPRWPLIGDLFFLDHRYPDGRGIVGGGPVLG